MARTPLPTNLAHLIGREILYTGSDGQRHYGVIRKIQQDAGRVPDGMVVWFSSGYTDGLWMSLSEARQALSKQVRGNTAKSA